MSLPREAHRADTQATSSMRASRAGGTGRSGKRPVPAQGARRQLVPSPAERRPLIQGWHRPSLATGDGQAVSLIPSLIHVRIPASITVYDRVLSRVYTPAWSVLDGHPTSAETSDNTFEGSPPHYPDRFASRSRSGIVAGRTSRSSRKRLRPAPYIGRLDQYHGVRVEDEPELHIRRSGR
jgi:hypothetical protein